MRIPALALVLASACQETPPPPAESPQTEAPATQATQADRGDPNILSTAPTTANPASVQGEPWSRLIDRAGDTIDAATASGLRESLAARSRDRTYEQQQIEAGLLQLEYQLVNDCSLAASTPVFTAYQTSEADSLQHDRDLLMTILTAAGPAGRGKILGDNAGIAELVRPRQSAVDQSATALPLWMATSPEEDERVALQRTFVSLNFTAEGSKTQTKAALSAWSNSLHGLDPASDQTTATVVDGMGQLDRHALDDQAKRFDAISGICGKVKVELWVNLLVGEWVSGYLGNLGGVAGLGQSAARRHATVQSLSSGGASQMGGGMGSPPGGQGGQGGQGGGMGSPGGQGGQGGGGQSGGQGGGQSGSSGNGQSSSTQVGAGQGFSASGFSGTGMQNGGAGSKEVGPPVGNNLPSRAGGSK